MNITIFDADPATRESLTEHLTGHTLTFHDGQVTPELLKAHPETEVVSVFVSSNISSSDLESLPNLKYIAARSTGVDHIDVAAAGKKNIVVSNVPRYGERTVAEFTFALMLGLSRRLPDAARQVKEEGNFKTATLEGFDLFGKVLGVIGTGSIGRNVVEIARAFGMSVLMYDVHPDPSFADEKARYVALDELLSHSDIVTLHVPYRPETHHILNAESFSKMKQGAFIVNTARGELIDTQALLEALKSGHIGGAGLDVLEEERSLKDEMQLVKGTESIHALKAIIRNHVLRDQPHVIITPHIAFFSREAYRQILETTAQNIISFSAGTPINVVKPL